VWRRATANHNQHDNIEHDVDNCDIDDNDVEHDNDY
jgi:hypothetical protein